MQPTKNKQSAKDFLELVIAGQIDEAYEKYADLSGKHHNTFTPAGFQALREGMKEAHVKFPNKQFIIQHIVGEDELVAVHSHLILEENKTDLAVLHLFRFKDERIVELWDLSQALSSDSPNKDGAF
jgi:predicted SnoaL-like aldol condensation-catalyzing enzyme